MGVLEFVFGRIPTKTVALEAPVIDAAPPGVDWRAVRARQASPPVRATLATRSGELKTRRGVLRYDPGQHYIVTYQRGDRSAVKRDIFERTYAPRPDGLYEKRRDVVHRYFMLPYAVRVLTPEGPQSARAGDWIMEGAEGELYPIARAVAARSYEPA